MFLSSGNIGISGVLGSLGSISGGSSYGDSITPKSGLSVLSSLGKGQCLDSGSLSGNGLLSSGGGLGQWSEGVGLGGDFTGTPGSSLEPIDLLLSLSEGLEVSCVV